MPIHFTVDTAVEIAANRWIASKHPDMGADRKQQILPATKYNLLVKTFNASTVLLVTAVAFAVLFAFSAAVTFGSIALFTRFTTDLELNKYSAPQNNLDALTKINHFIGLTDPADEVRNIFARAGVGMPANGWNQYEVFLFDHAVWRNEVPLPG
ncbi:MAG: hypothetical protein COT85_06470 [Chlamydiae bacterium CG10_big_fil_rev_8_21_14_0_10_42_34]|nr:MAG: hypothetical protein COT85_06470 [Chlamydiae bacterium CG10_big_fil_rev_8_21_14_0_10_42_34]